MQAVWDYKRSVFAHFVLTPLNLPDQKYIDTVVALAQPGALFIFDLGYFKITAFARLAAAGAYFSSRLNHQVHLCEATAGGVQPVELALLLHSVPGPLLEQPIYLGAKERVAVRLIASRVPEAIVNTRRRRAKEKAKKKGYTPSKVYLALLAWNLFISNVPPTIWQTATVLKAYPIRWQIDRRLNGAKVHGSQNFLVRHPSTKTQHRQWDLSLISVRPKSYRSRPLIRNVSDE
jgi:hypothetical protein